MNLLIIIDIGSTLVDRVDVTALGSVVVLSQLLGFTSVLELISARAKVLHFSDSYQ